MALNNNFNAFTMKKEESLYNKVPKAASHHLSAATTNADCKLGAGLLRQKKDNQQKGFVAYYFNRYKLLNWQEVTRGIQLSNPTCGTEKRLPAERFRHKLL